MLPALELLLISGMMFDVYVMFQFEHEKWKYQPECKILLYALNTSVPLRIKSDSTVDAAGDFKDTNG